MRLLEKSNTLKVLSTIKEEALPTWLGVPGTIYRYHGDWSDPEIEYKGCLYNEWDAQDFIGEGELGEELANDPNNFHKHLQDFAKKFPDTVKDCLDQLVPTGGIGVTVETEIEKAYDIDSLIGKLRGMKDTTNIPPVVLDLAIELATKHSDEDIDNTITEVLEFLDTNTKSGEYMYESAEAKGEAIKEAEDPDFEAKKDFLYAMYDKIAKAWNAIEWHDDMYYEMDMSVPKLCLIICVEWGDWKHDHLALEQIAEEATHPIKTSEVVTEEDGSDCFSADHYFYYSPKQFEDFKNGNLKESEEAPVEEKPAEGGPAYFNATDPEERIKNVYIMDRVLRGMNNEEALDDGWLMSGVADGDTEDGFENFKEESRHFNGEGYFYADDDTYPDLCKWYQRRVKKYAKDGVMSKEYFRQTPGNWSPNAGLTDEEIEFIRQDVPDFPIYGKNKGIKEEVETYVDYNNKFDYDWFMNEVELEIANVYDIYKAASDFERPVEAVANLVLQSVANGIDSKHTSMESIKRRIEKLGGDFESVKAGCVKAVEDYRKEMEEENALNESAAMDRVILNAVKGYGITKVVSDEGKQTIEFTVPKAQGDDDGYVCATVDFIMNVEDALEENGMSVDIIGEGESAVDGGTFTLEYEPMSRGTYKDSGIKIVEATDEEINKLKTELKSRAEDLGKPLSDEALDKLAQKIKKDGFFISNNIFTDDNDEHEWEQINMYLDNEIRKSLKESASNKEDLVWTSDGTAWVWDYSDEDIMNEYEDATGEKPEDADQARDYFLYDTDAWDIQKEDWDQNILPMIKEQTVNNIVILSGSIGLWHGTYDGGKVVSVDNLLTAMGDDIDLLELYRDPGNNQLYMEGHHHDGTHIMYLYTIPKEQDKQLEFLNAFGVIEWLNSIYDYDVNGYTVEEDALSRLDSASSLDDVIDSRGGFGEAMKLAVPIEFKN